MDRKHCEAVAARVAARDRHRTIHPAIIQEIVEDAADAYSDLFGEDVSTAEAEFEQIIDILRRALTEARRIDRDLMARAWASHGPILDILEEASDLLEAK